MTDKLAREKIESMKKDIEFLFKALYCSGLISLNESRFRALNLLSLEGMRSTMADWHEFPDENISAKLSMLVDYLNIEYIEEPKKKYFRKKVKA